MIFDNIKNCEMYNSVNPKFEKAFLFIKKAVAEKLPVGNYEIDGQDVYAFVQKYETKLMENSFFEGHEKYIDVQYIIKGSEILGVMDISKAVIKNEYSAESDAAFYERSGNASYCTAQQGDFCIFYPHDIHNPGVAFEDAPMEVEKIVVKIRV